MADHFVPVALNNNRLPETEDGQFFQVLMKQWPQGLWVVHPDGKVLGFHYHKPKPGESFAEGQKRWVNETRQMLQTAVQDSKMIPTTKVATRLDPLADRGKGTRQAGGVRLAVTVIGVRNGSQEGPPVVDSITLDETQWAKFRPPVGEILLGRKWTIPEDDARLFVPALSPMTDPIFSPTPRDATTAFVKANVERVDGKIAVIRLSGAWETSHKRDGDTKFPIHSAARGDGIGVLEVRTGRMITLVWLLKGTYRNTPPDKPRATAAIIEWSVK